MSELFFWFILPLWVMGGIVVLCMSFMFLVMTWSDIKKDGYASKDERQTLRNCWLCIFGALLGPASVVVVLIWGIYMLVRIGKDTLGLAFGRSKE